MALKNMSLLETADVAVTGGTPLVFSDNGITIANGVQLVVASDTDYQRRRTCTVKYKAPAVNPATGQFGKDKKSISLTAPTVDPQTGRIIFNTIRIEREAHPSLPAADLLELNKLAVQLLMDSDLDGYWANGSLS